MDIYRERAYLLAYLSAHMTWAHLASASDPEPGFSKVLCCHFREVVSDPTRHIWTWHIADSDLDLFAHLEEGENHWLGDTTEDKYNDMMAILGKYIQGAKSR